MVRPSDPLGRSVTISLQAPPDFLRLTQTLLAQGLFTFQTPQDALRWALKHGLTELVRRSKNKELTDEAAAMSAWTRVMAVEQEHMMYVSLLRNIGLTIMKLLEGGYAEQAEIAAEKVWADVDKVKSPYWREKYRKQMKWLLDRVRKAKSNGNGKQVAD